MRSVSARHGRPEGLHYIVVQTALMQRRVLAPGFLQRLQV
jgi:hypothetical protein